MWAEHDDVLKPFALMNGTFLQRKSFEIALVVSSRGVNLTRYPLADCDVERQHQRFHHGAEVPPSVWETVSGVARK